MAENPFASYNVEIAKEYHEEMKKFCQTGGAGVNYEFAPFHRMVDFWYFCFMVAIKEDYEPKDLNSGSVNITPASILSSNPTRILHIQMSFLADKGNIESMLDHRKVFDFANMKANAAMNHVLTMLNDKDDSPLWMLLDYVEEMAGDKNADDS